MTGKRITGTWARTGRRFFDLRNSLAHGSSIKEVAAFLMRRESEVHAKIHDLGLEEQK